MNIWKKAFKWFCQECKKEIPAGSGMIACFIDCKAIEITTRCEKCFKPSRRYKKVYFYKRPFDFVGECE